MSWRTHGIYKGLTKAQKAYLKAFDRKWDTKDEGRVRADAYDHMRDDCSPTAIRPKCDRKRPQLTDQPATKQRASTLEQEIATLTHEITRFTVPKQTREGWSIHLVLKSGEKIRVPFPDKAQAQQAYQTLQEASSIKIAA